MMSEGTRVYVILVNWHGWRDTIECLESVLRIDYPDYRVVVCDNNSQDNSLDHIKNWAEGNIEAVVSDHGTLRELSSPPVKKPIRLVEHDRESAEKGGDPADDEAKLVLIHTGASLGFAAGNNVGLRYALARGDMRYAWLLNNDTVVRPNALCRMVARVQAVPGAGICGSTLLSYEEPERVIALGGATFNRWFGIARHIGFGTRASDPVDIARIERRTAHAAGASMLVTSDFLREVGLMEEDYHIYFEELDWTLRAKGRFKSVFAADSVVYHKIGRSTGAGTHRIDRNWVSDAYLLKNRLVITRRFFPVALPLVYAGLIGTLFNRVRRRQWRGLGRIMRVLCGGKLK